MIIYSAIGKDNSTYIGATSNLKSRIATHKWRAKNKGQGKFYKHIRKYGIYFFKFEILSKANNTYEMYELEKSFINLFDSYNNGLNGSLGGIENNGIKVTKKRIDAAKRQMQKIYNSDAIKKARKKSLTPEKQRERSKKSHDKKEASMPVFYVIDRRTKKIVSEYRSHTKCAKDLGYTKSTIRCGLIRNAPTKKYIFKYKEVYHQYK